MRKKLVMFAVVILMVSFAGAEKPQKAPQRFKSLKEATGWGNPPSNRLESEYWDGRVPMKIATSDGEKFVGGTPRVIIFRANTEADGDILCNTAVPNDPHPILGDGPVWVQLFSEKFTPLMPDPSYLEVIWSGQLSVSQPLQPQEYPQAALVECTVSQAGVSVPCSGTEGIPVMAEAETDDGYQGWITYSGYVEIDPNIETTVDIRLHAFPMYDGVVDACGDTLTLKY